MGDDGDDEEDGDDGERNTNYLMEARTMGTAPSPEMDVVIF